MRRLKFFVVVATMGLVVAAGIYQSGLISHETTSSLEGRMRKARFTFVMEGNVSNGRYSHVAIADTLQWYLNEYGPGEKGSLKWGMELLQREPAPGIVLASDIENFRMWGEMEFAAPSDRFAWMENLLFSPHVIMTPSPTADNDPAGLAELRLPMMDGSGGWLILPGLRYTYSLA